MTHEKGMFGYTTNCYGDIQYGYYIGIIDHDIWLSFDKNKLNKENMNATGKGFTPCYEPLPLEPDFKDWAKGYMCLYKSVLLVGVDSYGDGYADTDTQKWGLHFHRPEWVNMKYTRADLFPEPEAKPALKTLGAVLDFCLNNDELSNEEMTAMLEAEGFDIGRFLPEALKAIKKVLDPAKLGEKE